MEKHTNMEIKQLVSIIQTFKQLRNDIELGIDTLSAEDTANAKEINDRDRAGLDWCSNMASNEGINDAANNMKYGLKQINEGICNLEMAYRRSVRYYKTPEAKPEQEKKPE